MPLLLIWAMVPASCAGAAASPNAHSDAPRLEEPPPASASAEARFEAALEAAAAIESGASEIRPPAPAFPRTRDESSAFGASFSAWHAEHARGYDNVTSAFRAAADLAPSARERSNVELRLVRAMAMHPRAHLENAARGIERHLHASFFGVMDRLTAVSKVVVEEREAALRLASAMIDRARASDLPATDVAALETEVEAIRRIGTSDDRHAIVGRMLLPLPERSRVPTTRSGACELAGSARGHATLRRTPEGPDVARLAVDGSVEVERLAVPAQAGGVAALSLRWPLRFDGFAARGARLWQVLDRVEVVPGHVWVAAGQAVSLSEPKQATVRVVRSLSPHHPEAVAKVRGVPAALDARLACSQIDLASDVPGLRSSGELAALPFVSFKDETVTLYDRPGGRGVAVIRGDAFGFTGGHVSDKQPGWLHLLEKKEIELDAWVTEASVGGARFIGFVSPGHHTFVAIAEFPVRADPDGASKRIGTVANGAPLVLGALVDAAVEVRVAGIASARHAGWFFADPEVVDASTRAATP